MAVVAQALCGLGRSAVKSRTLALVGAAALAAIALGVSELVVLFAAGLAMAALERGRLAAPSGNSRRRGTGEASALPGTWNRRRRRRAA